MKDRQIMFTLSQLKKRGWTDKLVLRLLKNPDALKLNPFARSAPPMRLYDAKRVLRIEKSAKFRSAVEASKNRRAGARKAVATKTATTLAYANDARISVVALPRDELERAALASYNDRLARITDGLCEHASRGSDPEFVARLCVNYLRHECTEYEDHLDATMGRVGARQAYPLIKCKTLAEISSKYPWLADECARQLRRSVQ